MGKPWQWLKMAPLLYPLVYAHGQRHAPALTCSTAHNLTLRKCEKQKLYFWQALRDCSVPPRLDHEESTSKEDNSSGAWSKREQAVDWLKLTDRELQMQCRVETLRSSGPGGQHRNKTESAVRLLHLPTGCLAFAAEDRSQHKNRTKALKRLREVIALEVRRPVELEGYEPPLELRRILPSVPKALRKREGGQKIGPNHDDFVQGIQSLLDLLGVTKGSISECASILGLSTGALSRLLVSNKMLWKGVNNLRAAHNLKAIRGD